MGKIFYQKAIKYICQTQGCGKETYGDYHCSFCNAKFIEKMLNISERKQFHHVIINPKKDKVKKTKIKRINKCLLDSRVDLTKENLIEISKSKSTNEACEILKISPPTYRKYLLFFGIK